MRRRRRGSELTCKIIPPSGTTVPIMGDFVFKPKIVIPSTATPGSTFLGGSVLYCKVPGQVPGAAVQPTVMATVNYIVKVK